MKWYNIQDLFLIILVAGMGVGVGIKNHSGYVLMTTESDVRYIGFIILFSLLLYMFETFYNK